MGPVPVPRKAYYGASTARALINFPISGLRLPRRHLEKPFAFPDFRQALAFTNRVGELAEEIKHHPDIELSWGKVVVRIWTHKIDGLVEADFILAAKVDRVMG